LINSDKCFGFFYEETKSLEETNHILLSFIHIHIIKQMLRNIVTQSLYITRHGQINTANNITQNQAHQTEGGGGHLRFFSPLLLGPFLSS